ncbi:DASH family cryptochrome [Undibacterium baiyunense]|uniref:Cryptochrome DASH n=1 Tax=Undibacterium baiyunense TaxID=2828731 RepID=A0A941DE14_9BURK|nr:DASH family cryptochrome [Undibacterium baiyunense]MBR7747009.1 DASH family cryptochrome [Undibacterium baiyunense]
MKKLVVYWFRNDLRVEDNPALNAACAYAQRTGAQLLPLFCHTSAQGTLHVEQTQWGFARLSAHRRYFLRDSLLDLREQLQQFGFELMELEGELSAQSAFLAALAQTYTLQTFFCEDIAAPEERAQVDAVRALQIDVQAVWQSTMYDPTSFDFDITQMPDQFTAFRHKIEHAAYPIRQVVSCALSASFALRDATLEKFSVHLSKQSQPQLDALDDVDTQVMHDIHDVRSSFPYFLPEFRGGSRAAHAHLKNYFSSELPHSYKQTRNQLQGTRFSTKFSPWLASGALSAPQVMAALREFEAEKGQSDSTYWIWFELLWRDYFRYLHCKYGVRLYRASGLSKLPVDLPAFDAQKFQAWTQSMTGESLIDAAMRELTSTGYLSNRLRQQVISYWLHELGGDWRVAAAWFESQLLDYDVYSNQGNCLYLAGLGTDPRGYLGGRWFDPKKQAKQHDADGSYRTLWNSR